MFQHAPEPRRRDEDQVDEAPVQTAPKLRAVELKLWSGETIRGRLVPSQPGVRTDEVEVLQGGLSRRVPRDEVRSMRLYPAHVDVLDLDQPAEPAKGPSRGGSSERPAR